MALPLTSGEPPSESLKSSTGTLTKEKEAVPIHGYARIKSSSMRSVPANVRSLASASTLIERKRGPSWMSRMSMGAEPVCQRRSAISTKRMRCCFGSRDDDASTDLEIIRTRSRACSID